MDAMEGVGIGVGFVVFIMLVFAFGQATKKETIAEACDKFGAFEAQGTIYDCKQRVTP